MKFSVIIPVYQAESTIERCLDSLLNQPFTDKEIIIVNDGATDRSGEICREYAQRHPCIRYFEKVNGGVSSARNLGLDHVQGEYVLFVDSDDYVTDQYFRELDSATGVNAPDLLLFGNYNSRSPGQQMNCHEFYANDLKTSAEIISDLMRANRFNALWIKCFSSRLIKRAQLRFDDSIEIAEDLNFIFSYIVHCTSVKSIPVALYVVDESNTESLSRKKRPDLANQLHHACLSMVETLDSTQLPKQAKDCYENALSWLYYRSVYSSAKELCKTGVTGAGRRKELRKICRQFAAHRISTVGWNSKLIAAPVRYRMAWLIDCLANSRR